MVAISAAWGDWIETKGAAPGWPIAPYTLIQTRKPNGVIPYLSGEYFLDVKWWPSLSAVRFRAGDAAYAAYAQWIAQAAGPATPAIDETAIFERGRKAERAELATALRALLAKLEG